MLQIQANPIKSTHGARTRWTMASVRSSEAFCRTRLRMWIKISQSSKWTTLEKAGQKAGGTGGHSADKCRGEEQHMLKTLTSACAIAYLGQHLDHLYHYTPELSFFSGTLQPAKQVKEMRKSWSKYFKSWRIQLLEPQWATIIPCCVEFLNSDRRKD